MYNLDSDGEHLDVPSHRSPTIVIHDALLLINLEVHSSTITEKGLSERHSMIQDEDHHSSYNIEEIFGSFTFNLCRKEFRQKRIRKVKKNHVTVE